MRALGLLLLTTGLLAGASYLGWLLLLSGVSVGEFELRESGLKLPLPDEIALSGKAESYSMGPIALDPSLNPLRATLVLWGSGLGVEYGVALVDPSGQQIWRSQGRRKKQSSSGRSTSILGSFEVTDAHDYRLLLSLTPRPGLVPSGGSVRLRGRVALFRWPPLLAAALAVLLGGTLAARGRSD